MSTQVALGAIGGAIDRATLALLWLGRGVCALTTLSAVYWWVGVAAHTWWTMPQEWPANFTPIKHDPITAIEKKVGTHEAYSSSDLDRRKLEATRSGKWWEAGPMVFALELPDKRILQVLAFDDDAAFAGAREWWWNEQIKTSQARIKDGLWRPVGAFLVGAIFLGLTRVTRWIVTGR